MAKHKVLRMILITLVLALGLSGCVRLGDLRKPDDNDGDLGATSDSLQDVQDQQRQSEIPVVTTDEIFKVDTTLGIVYGKGLSHSDWNSDETKEISLLLDLYQPIDAPDNRPAIVLIHGGSFVTGSRMSTSFVQMAEYYASRGWVAISIDYRLVEDHGTVPAAWGWLVESRPTSLRTNQLYAFYPAARDAKTAIRWLNAHAESYGVNPDFITVAGGSAGAYTAVGIGVTDAEDYRDELTLEEDPTLVDCYLAWPSAVHTIIDYWGGNGLVNAIDLVYEKDSFDILDPPIQIVHGDEDNVVDYSKAEELVKIYEEIGVPYELYTLTGEGHSAWQEMVDGRTLSQLAFDFIVEQQGLSVWRR